MKKIDETKRKNIELFSEQTALVSNKDVCLNEIVNGMTYYAPIISGDNIYSVDNLRVDFFLTDEISHKICADEHWIKQHIKNAVCTDTDKRPHHYTEVYKVVYDKDATMCLHLVLNSSVVPNRCYLEVNPNKCFNIQQCLDDIMFLLSNSTSYTIKRLDAAVDVPVVRKSVSVIKDKRTKIDIYTTKDSPSEYLGKKRNTRGRVKVYDKHKEAGLPYNLTRVELTLGNPLGSNWNSDLIKTLPEIYIKQGIARRKTYSVKLNDTEKVLVDLLLESPKKLNYWNRLCYREKKKIEAIIKANEKKLEFDCEAIYRAAMSIVDTLTLYNTYIGG